MEDGGWRLIISECARMRWHALPRSGCCNRLLRAHRKHQASFREHDRIDHERVNGTNHAMQDVRLLGLQPFLLPLL